MRNGFDPMMARSPIKAKRNGEVQRARVSGRLDAEDESAEGLDGVVGDAQLMRCCVPMCAGVDGHDADWGDGLVGYAATDVEACEVWGCEGGRDDEFLPDVDGLEFTGRPVIYCCEGSCVNTSVL